jgi:hypothetical protein
MDRPAVVFRFTPGELSDPVDAASLRVTVDGEDRSAHFQVTGTEAWGLLTDPRAGRRRADLRPGVHVVAARICSVRGICASTVVALTALPPGGGHGPIWRPCRPEAPTRLQRVVDLLLAALRKLVR